MSREIKFRIWDDFKKEWLGASDNDALTFYGFHLVGEVMTVQCPPQWALDPCCIVEQYTGLKDKNGKEIYEGDIVLDYYDGDDAFIVKWGEDTARFILTGTDNIAEVSFDNFFPDKDLEVIGNIHENSELIGGEE